MRAGTRLVPDVKIHSLQVSVITSVGHTDTKIYYQCGVLIDSTDGATLLSKVLAQTN